MEAKFVYDNKFEVLAVLDENFMIWYRVSDIFKIITDIDGLTSLSLLEEFEIENIKTSNGSIELFTEQSGLFSLIYLSELPYIKDFKRWIFLHVSVNMVHMAHEVKSTELTIEKLQSFKPDFSKNDKVKLQKNLHHAIDLLSPEIKGVSNYERICAWNYIDTFLNKICTGSIEYLNPNTNNNDEKLLFAAYTQVKYGIDLAFKHW